MPFGTANILALGLLTTFLAPASAFWRLPCKAPIVVQRADPIVNPGKISGHVHTIMGGNGFGFDMNFADTQKSTCSSCTVTKDLSNYWVPALYYKAQDGTFKSINQVGGALVYYLQRTDQQDPEYAKGLLAFPEGFRMIAGNPFLRSFSDTLEQKAINFHCLGTTNPETNELPNYNCPDGLRAQVFFPSCWDGVNLDSPDHKSHMAYPSRTDNGFCPPSHPKRFISLFYEVVWDTNVFKDMWYGGKQPFVFSQGDETGYGYHGDFVNGWDVPTLQRAVTECTNLSGVVEDCHVFDFFTDDFANGCKIPTSIDEQVKGNLAALPGCNPVQSGPAMAVAKTGCGAPTTISTPENPYVDLTASKGFAYVGCGTDSINGRVYTGASLTSKTMTNEACVDFCVSKGFTVAGTEYSDECYCGNTIPAASAPVPGLMGNCLMPCAGDATENCGGGGLISLYQKCTGGKCQNVQYDINNSTAGSGTPASSGSPGASSSSSALPANVSPSGEVSAPAAASPTKSNSLSSAAAQVDNGSSSVATIASTQAAAGTAPVVIVQTQTVVPLAASPSSMSADTTTGPANHEVSPSSVSSPVASAPAAVGGVSGECGQAYTVTVALLTVTVTAMPSSHSAPHSDSSPSVETESTVVLPSSSEDLAVATNTPTISEPTPVETPIVSAPYVFSNGTSTHTHGHHHASSGLHNHRKGHAHATGKRMI